VPILLAGIAAAHGIPASNPEFLKVADPGSRFFPLFPDKIPQPSHYPDFEPFEEGFGFRKPKVVPPSPKVSVQILNNLPQAFTPLAAGQFPDLVLEAFHAFGMNSDLFEFECRLEFGGRSCYVPFESFPIVFIVNISISTLKQWIGLIKLFIYYFNSLSFDCSPWLLIPKVE
jgi:hypothetical protein